VTPAAGLSHQLGWAHDDDEAQHEQQATNRDGRNVTRAKAVIGIAPWHLNGIDAIRDPLHRHQKKDRSCKSRSRLAINPVS
jgi:hypothetical protein